jgi:hypothetical protein
VACHVPGIGVSSKIIIWSPATSPHPTPYTFAVMRFICTSTPPNKVWLGSSPVDLIAERVMSLKPVKRSRMHCTSSVLRSHASLVRGRTTPSTTAARNAAIKICYHLRCPFECRADRDAMSSARKLPARIHAEHVAVAALTKST